MVPSLQRLGYIARTYSWMTRLPLWPWIPPLPIDRPVFLLGTQGGGLTLLSRMLRRHPSVVSAAGNAHYWTSADEIQNVFGAILPPELTGLRFKAPPHPYLPAPRSWTYASRDLFQHYRKTHHDASLELERALTQVIRACLWLHAPNPNGARFVDKSQVFTVRVGLIAALLRNAKPHFVLVTREPYASIVRAARGGAADMKVLRAYLPLEERLDICAEHYANSFCAALDDLHRESLPFLQLRFEDLLNNPKDVLTQVCDFAQLDFCEDMLPAAHHALPWGSRFAERWFPLRPEVNTAYARDVSAEAITIINRRLGDLFQTLGYKRNEGQQ